MLFIVVRIVIARRLEHVLKSQGKVEIHFTSGHTCISFLVSTFISGPGFLCDVCFAYGPHRAGFTELAVCMILLSVPPVDSGRKVVIGDV